MDDLDRKYRLGDNAPVRIDDDLAEDLIELTERVKARRRATVDKEIAAYKSGMKEANIYGAGSNEPAEDPDFADLAHRIDTEVLRKQLEETKRKLAAEKTYAWKSYTIGAGLQEKEEELSTAMNRLLYSGHRPSPLQGLAALAGGVPPETMMLALAYYLSDHPAEFFSKEAWGSKAAQEKRDWLRDNGLIDANDEPTGKLSVWLEAALATPLPVQRWEVER